jgi:hypothetical protein
MYLFENALGEVFKPRPAAPTPKPPPKPPAQRPPKEGWIAKDGHRRFCGAPDKRSVSCDLNVKVRFRRSFDEFLHAVENAYGRWMDKRTARMLVQKLQMELQKWHQEMLDQKLFDNDPINIVAGLNYRRPGTTWLVNDSSLRQWWRLIDI